MATIGGGSLLTATIAALPGKQSIWQVGVLAALA
jgi:hypothetical protein